MPKKASHVAVLGVLVLGVVPAAHATDEPAGGPASAPPAVTVHERGWPSAGAKLPTLRPSPARPLGDLPRLDARTERDAPGKGAKPGGEKGEGAQAGKQADKGRKAARRTGGAKLPDLSRAELRQQAASAALWWKEQDVAAVPSPTGDLDIPLRALTAYRAAAAQWSECGVGWSVLAGIGRVESHHADQGQLYPDGRTFETILGPVLDGGAFANIADSDGGRLDGDLRHDRAVGPMQFLPGTWEWVGVDADLDGAADPNDLDDAAASAARYLCASGEDLTTEQGLAEALLTYNQSRSYVASVMQWADGYAQRAAAVAGADLPESSPVPGLPEVGPERPTAPAVTPPTLR